MLRLSILVPFLGDRDSLENTLASVLQNRPDGSEVVVALAREYDDPYQLDQEVRFVPVSGGLLDGLNQGFVTCQAPVVHPLACGAAVSDGWADRALEHFRDRRVASVAPLIVDAEQPERVAAAGLEYHFGGACTERGRGTSAEAAAELPGEPIGPSAAAGFYRRSALGDGRPPFDVTLGPELAGVDLALRLREAGYVTVCEPSSRVLQARDKEVLCGGFTQARQAERLFWRHVAADGWGRSLAAHGLFAARELAGSLPHPRAAAQIAGRLLGVCEWGYARRQRLRFALPPLADEGGESCSERRPSGRTEHRLDRPHLHRVARPGGGGSAPTREVVPSPLSDKRL